MTNEKFENLLKTALIQDIDEQETEVRFEENIRDSVEINHEFRKESRVYMFNGKYKKVAVVAAIACMVIGTTAFAGTRVKYLESSSGSSIDKYSAFTDIEKAEKKAGYNADILESFSNGYEFDHADIAHTNGIDDDGNKVVSFKELTTTYKNASGHSLHLNTYNTADYNDPEENIPAPDEVRSFDGIEVKYTVYRYLLNVPEDAELTDEEKAFDEAGKLWMSYDGGDDIEKYDVAVISWQKEGIRYSIQDSHAAESADSLFGMAEELITK